MSDPKVEKIAAIAASLSEAQRRAVLDAKLDRWPGPTMIYRVWYESTEDALALWRLKIVTEYTNVEDWFSPLSDLGLAVRDHLKGESHERD